MKKDTPHGMPSDRTSATLVYAATALGVALLILLEARTFLLIMDSRVNINEHVFLASSFLYLRFSLYKDFAFHQMPYIPLLYGTIFKITGTTHYLLTGRIMAFLFANLGAAAVFLIARRYTKNIAVAAMLVMIFLLNEGMFKLHCVHPLRAFRALLLHRSHARPRAQEAPAFCERDSDLNRHRLETFLRLHGGAVLFSGYFLSRFWWLADAYAHGVCALDPGPAGR